MKKKREDIFVSVIMPSYNTNATFFREAIESILEQSHENFELLITIDGSSNDNIKIAREYEKKDNRVVVIDNIFNKGLVYSLNNMLDMSKGEYIFRMDSDDVSCRKRLEYSIDYMEQYPEVDICGGAARYIINGTKKIRLVKMPQSDIQIKSTMFFKCPMIHPSIVFRAKTIKEKHIHYLSSETSEDYKLWIYCAMENLCFSNISKCLIFYRIHEAQATSMQREKLLDNDRKLLKRWVLFNRVDVLDNQFEAFFKFSRMVGKITRYELSSADDFLNNVVKSTSDNKRRGVLSIFTHLFYVRCIRLIFLNRYRPGKELNRVRLLFADNWGLLRIGSLKMLGFMMKIFSVNR